jgi:hypothetical protein
MSTIIRNGKAYDSVDVKVQMNGFPIEVTSLTYGNAQEHQLNHTLGEDATSWSTGKKTPNAKMGIMMHDIVPLEKAAKGGSILKIKPFVLTVEFVNEYNEIIVDIITAKFQTEGREVTGDMGLKMDYDLFALSVKLNAFDQTLL